MIEIKGKVNTAICYATVVEDEAIEQIRRMCDHDFTAGSQIRIMPDVHAGKGCTIGTTMTITDKAVPNIVGVDIGCGMYTAELGKVDVDFEKVDAAAHYIPSGRDVWEGRIRKQLEADLASDAEVSLLAKWLPSVNASNAETVRKAKRIARYLGMSDAEYRKTLVELRKKIRIIENHLREKDYSFDYAKQPSKAMFKYRKAFLRNDGERYNAFLEAVSSGEKQLHADNLAPYEIVRSALNANRWGFHADLTVGEKAALNASWASLPDFCDNRNALAVVDTSGSMYCYDNALPAAVALSLGLYFGERNTGIFHNHFIEFSSRPQLIEIKGKTFAERLEYLCTFNEVADTNVEAVFDLILDAAVRNNVPQEEMPETLYLISDMEFNACVRNASVSNFASAKRRFAEHGYRLPQIVFWNVASRNSNQPVTKNEQGVALVSGCTPRLFSMVASGDLSPYSVMMDIIESERYAKISA